MTYTQVRLGRKNTYQTVWIPTKFAKVGKFLRILEVDGWKVLETYATYPEEFVNKYKNDFRTAFPSLQN